MKTAADLINEARGRIKEVDAQHALKEHGSNTVFVDCREPNEYNLGRVPGAVFIPRGRLEQDIEARVPRDSQVIIYCASGNRSALAADTLQVMGYNNVASLAGGFRAWVMSGGEVEG